MKNAFLVFHQVVQGVFFISFKSAMYSAAAFDFVS
jgi:hypothetical protein